MTLQKIVNGKLVDTPPDEIAASTPSLDQLKNRKKDAVNRIRDERLVSDFAFNGVVYQADERSQERLDRARASALAAIIGGAQVGNYRWHGEDVDFFWIAKDNSRIDMDAHTTLAFGNAVVAREGLLISAGDSLKKTIDAASDQNSLDAIDIEAGWPSEKGAS